MSGESVEKPVPHPSSLSAPYWQATAEGKLRLQRCVRCGKVRHYPQLLCSDCYSDQVEWITASGLGMMESISGSPLTQRAIVFSGASFGTSD